GRTTATASAAAGRGRRARDDSHLPGALVRLEALFLLGGQEHLAVELSEGPQAQVAPPFHREL
ncbi:MAG: hypothetical protein WBF71_11755, partial [Microthrixaceae bacterium]